MSFKLTDIVHLPVNLRALAIGHGSIGGRFLQMRRHAGRRIHRRNHERLLLAQGVGQQAEGSDLAGRIHPDFLIAHGQQGNDVIELRR